MAKKTIALMIVLSALMLSACNFPLFSNSDDDGAANALATAVSETVQALSNQPDLPQDQQQEAPLDQLPTITPLPTLTQQAVQSPPTQTPLPCDKALFISETIPDDTPFASGEAFTKSWTFKNVGTCTWNTDYKMVFSTGDAMGGPVSVNVPAAVAPNAQVAISVNLTAPTDPGTYTGYWKLQADDNEQFGQVYVRIKTESVLFQVTSVTYYMPHTTINMACPGPLAIKGEITTSTAGQVTYYWTDDQGGQSATKAINFTAAEAKIVDYTMTVNGAGAHWAKLYIDQPNHQLFGPINFTVNCP
ncbi:MAG: NBR1-Ig-like domain-containing protein [Pelolinea sp.]|nr:NBR1-Ig-like domain-containing protein [Pelolinea sp.]